MTFLYFFKKFVSARNKIGEGGYGTVFKGRWKHQEVAIKRIRKKQGASEEDLNKAISQLFKELQTLSCFRFSKFSNMIGVVIDDFNFRSEYIVPILTFSTVSFSGTSEPAIVYQVYFPLKIKCDLCGKSSPHFLPQWMPNGSLEGRLKKEPGLRDPLTWRQR